MLEKLYVANPQHPGITHYLIHAYDFAPFADKGIGAARRYASIAPAVPHARHMPAHIYSMVGLWQDSITSNTSALEIQPDYYHAADFTVYAHLQLAQDQQASKLIEKALATPERGDRPATMANYTAKVAMPARYVLERADWKAAAALPIGPTEHPMADSLAHFTRGLGMARLGDRSAASKEIDAMQRLRASMEKGGDSYWAARTGEQILAVSAWITLADGAVDKAIAQARQAADGEEASIKHVAMENRLYPLRELLGDLLLEAKRPKEAYAEYVASLKQYPNRFRGLYGAARAAEAAGDSANAGVYYRRLVDLAANADAVRPEVRQAQNYVSRR
jgi:tetratricopeptide (TPR) repeat protein